MSVLAIIIFIVFTPIAGFLSVILYYYEGYATAEIAEFLQIPNGTARTRLARGREQLKKILKEAE